MQRLTTEMSTGLSDARVSRRHSVSREKRERRLTQYTNTSLEIHGENEDLQQSLYCSLLLIKLNQTVDPLVRVEPPYTAALVVCVPASSVCAKKKYKSKRR